MIGIFLGLLLFTVVAHFVRKKLLQRSARAVLINQYGCKPPRHVRHSDPVLGIDYYLGGIKAFNNRRYLERLRTEFSKYGPTFQFSELAVENIATREPENFKAALSTNFDDWGVQQDRAIPLAPLAGENFFCSDGPIWHYSRDLIRPAISRSEYSNFDRLEVFVCRFLDLIPRDAATVDMLPLCGRLMSDYMSDHLFDRPIDSLTLEANFDQKALSEAIQLALKNSTERFMLAGTLGKMLAWIPLSKEVSKACSTVHEYIDNAIMDAAKQQGKAVVDDSHYVFLHEMIKHSADRPFLRNLMVVMYIASTDTTANILGQVIFELSRNPQVVEKLRHEILALGNQPITLASLQKLPYLRAVINETLRMYHIAGFIVRYAVHDTILPRGGGPDGTSPVFVKKGMRLFLAFQALHYDTSSWGADAASFRPERFLDRKPSSWTFLPFGGGGRACPGQNLAIANLSYVIVRLLQEFENIESRDERPWTEELRLVTVNANGVHVAFRAAQ